MIPVAVNKVIENYQNAGGVSAEVEAVSSEGVSSEKIVRMVLMNDTLGRMQVIFPGDCLLDVDVLNKKLGRHLVALPNEDVSSLAERFHLSQLPAVPELTGLPTIIDSRIRQLEDVYMESGTPGSLLKVNRALFEAFLKKASEESFAVPVSEIQLNRNSPDEDVAQIHQAIEKFTSLRIKQRLEDTLELPPLPQSALDIIKLRSNPDAGVGELADIVERDPSLSAQVVSWASSSFYNAPGKIKSVHDAIVRVLGFDLVMNLAMGLALGKTLQQPKDQPDGYAPYWQDAMWMALGASAVLSKIPHEHRPGFGMAYLSGLLHNFGYLVLAHVFPPHFGLICRYIEANPHLDSAYIEHHLLGITREQVGSQLMAIWNMPVEILVALRHQKNRDYEGGNREYANVLYLAKNLLAQKGVYRGQLQPVDDALLESLHLTREAAGEAIEQLYEARDEVLAMAGMMGR